MASVPQELLRELEIEGYTAVMRAIYAGTYDWEKEEILTKLRSILNIDNNRHADVLATVKEEMQSLRSGVRVPQKQTPLAARVGSSTYPVAPGSGTRKQPGVGARPPAAGTPRGPSGLGGKNQRAKARPGADPYGYVGRRVWRYWPSENPPWVEGYIHDYEPESGTHSILYDPNQPGRETVEDSYSFAEATAADFVLGEFVDLKTMVGSRRVADRPQDAILPTNPALDAGFTTPSSGGMGASNKKRRSQAATQVPAHAPFDPAWLQGRLQVAAEEELQGLQAVLDQREAQILSELNHLEGAVVSDEDHLARAELEAQLKDLCERETKLMAELASMVVAEE
ncbi:hypothetical protein QBZ16_002165 [Prototheca wickerhamii]|uniref:ENT domain-containing protein n=1 Tax=Prototheca wickerhamii TaxID=3111 RepID=A0AAD9MLI5_PROWI|nr:hypothetical protein QBZ16_002165 [Prototheca wickerhamii]